MIEPQKPQGISNWLRESVMIKLFFIGFLTLVLLIPSSMISDLITERSERQGQVDEEISQSWAGEQLIQAPVLVIPYKKQITEKTADNKTITKEQTDVVYTAR